MHQPTTTPTTSAMPLGVMSAVRPATQADVAGILALVQEHARRGEVLPRTRDAIEASLDDWLVAVAPRGGTLQVLGCVQLLAYSPRLGEAGRLVEVRSLAVADAAQGQGLGSRLMVALLSEARRRHVDTLFALTHAVPFFQRFGFTVTEHSRFPEKVWRDCRACPLRERCTETAVILKL
jgi:N-acetylglutamate synthase-like GNAT family acetyltransferase